MATVLEEAMRRKVRLGEAAVHVIKRRLLIADSAH
jgi:hypothetical protein